eukprot:366217-Chlamydomonas_euryale.AAC.21
MVLVRYTQHGLMSTGRVCQVVDDRHATRRQTPSGVHHRPLRTMARWTWGRRMPTRMARFLSSTSAASTTAPCARTWCLLSRWIDSARKICQPAGTEHVWHVCGGGLRQPDEQTCCPAELNASNCNLRVPLCLIQ